MKTIINLGLLTLACVFVCGSCTKYTPEIDGTYDANDTDLTIGADQKELSFGSDSVFTNVKFESNFWWNAAVEAQSHEGELESQGWFSMTPLDNFGSRPVRMTISRNMEKYERRVKLSFTSESKPDFNKTLTVIQAAATPTIEKSLNYKDCSLTGTTFELLLTTTEQWTTTNPDWCTITPASGGKCKNMVVSVTINANNTKSDRVGEIEFVSSEDESVHSALSIDQAGEVESPKNVVVANDDELKISFDKVRGALYYTIDMYKPASDTPLTKLKVMPPENTETQQITYDLTNFDLSVLKGYYGAVDVKVTGYYSDDVFESAEALVGVSLLFGDGSGSGSSATESLLIRNMRHFNNVKLAMDAHFRQEANLSFKDIQFAPIGRDIKGTDITFTPFSGLYDGNNKSISDVTYRPFNEFDLYLGLFAIVQGEVKNLRVENFFLAAGGPSSKETDRVILEQNSKYGFGTVVGLVEGGKITNCHADNCKAIVNIIASDNTKQYEIWAATGGIAGWNNGGVISDCTTANGSIQNCSAAAKKSPIGGIVGINGLPQDGGSVGSVITRCKNISTTILVNRYANSAGVVIYDRENYAGGIAGCNFNMISYCVNSADVTGTQHTGGIAGTNLPPRQSSFAGFANSWLNSTCVVYCVNTGTIKNMMANGDSHCAGIMGYMLCDGDGTKVTIDETQPHLIPTSGIVYCANRGKVISSYQDQTWYAAKQGFMGGIAGRIAGGYIANCYNGGEVMAEYANAARDIKNQYAAGIVGYMESKTGVMNSYNACDFTQSNLRDADAAKFIFMGGITARVKDSGNKQDKSFSVVGGNASSQANAAGANGTIITPDDLANQSTFPTASGWNFTSIWSYLATEYKYPVLKNSPQF